MAIYRNVSMSFWTDSKVADDFTAEDRYFFLYLFTNPHTNLCGCYEVSPKQMAYETGLSQQKIRSLIRRMSEEHNVIRYCEETKEVLIVNWNKYNWTESEKFRKPLAKEINLIKCDSFRGYLTDIYNGIDTVSIGYAYPTDTTVTVSDTVTDTVSVTVSDAVSVSVTDTDMYKEEREEIITYFNETCGTHYRADTKEIKKLVNGLLKQNFTVEDFKTVIYKKAKQWMDDPKMCKYLRPQTLFTGKFEGYLNEKEALTFAERLAMA